MSWQLAGLRHHRQRRCKSKQHDERHSCVLFVGVIFSLPVTKNYAKSNLPRPYALLFGQTYYDEPACCLPLVTKKGTTTKPMDKSQGWQSIRLQMHAVTSFAAIANLLRQKNFKTESALGRDANNDINPHGMVTLLFALLDVLISFSSHKPDSKKGRSWTQVFLQ